MLRVLELHKRDGTWKTVDLGLEPVSKATCSRRAGEEGAFPPFAALLVEAFRDDSQLRPLAAGYGFGNSQLVAAANSYAYAALPLAAGLVSSPAPGGAANSPGAGVAALGSQDATQCSPTVRGSEIIPDSPAGQSQLSLQPGLHPAPALPVPGVAAGKQQQRQGPALSPNSGEAAVQATPPDTGHYSEHIPAREPSHGAADVLATSPEAVTPLLLQGTSLGQEDNFGGVIVQATPPQAASPALPQGTPLVHNVRPALEHVSPERGQQLPAVPAPAFLQSDFDIVIEAPAAAAPPGRAGSPLFEYDFTQASPCPAAKGGWPGPAAFARQAMPSPPCPAFAFPPCTQRVEAALLDAAPTALAQQQQHVAEQGEQQEPRCRMLAGAGPGPQLMQPMLGQLPIGGQQQQQQQQEPSSHQPAVLGGAQPAQLPCLALVQPAALASAVQQLRSVELQGLPKGPQGEDLAPAADQEASHQRVAAIQAALRADWQGEEAQLPADEPQLPSSAATGDPPTAAAVCTASHPPLPPKGPDQPLGPGSANHGGAHPPAPQPQAVRSFFMASNAPVPQASRQPPSASGHWHWGRAQGAGLQPAQQDLPPAGALHGYHQPHGRSDAGTSMDAPAPAALPRPHFFQQHEPQQQQLQLQPQPQPVTRRQWAGPQGAGAPAVAQQAGQRGEQEQEEHPMGELPQALALAPPGLFVSASSGLALARPTANAKAAALMRELQELGEGPVLGPWEHAAEQRPRPHPPEPTAVSAAVQETRGPAGSTSDAQAEAGSEPSWAVEPYTARTAEQLFAAEAGAAAAMAGGSAKAGQPQFPAALASVAPQPPLLQQGAAVPAAAQQTGQQAEWEHPVGDLPAELAQAPPGLFVSASSGLAFARPAANARAVALMRELQELGGRPGPGAEKFPSGARVSGLPRFRHPAPEAVSARQQAGGYRAGPGTLRAAEEAGASGAGAGVVTAMGDGKLAAPEPQQAALQPVAQQHQEQQSSKGGMPGALAQAAPGPSAAPVAVVVHAVAAAGQQPPAMSPSAAAVAAGPADGSAGDSASGDPEAGSEPSWAAEPYRARTAEQLLVAEEGAAAIAAAAMGNAALQQQQQQQQQQAVLEPAAELHQLSSAVAEAACAVHGTSSAATPCSLGTADLLALDAAEAQWQAQHAQQGQPSSLGKRSRDSAQDEDGLNAKQSRPSPGRASGSQPHSPLPASLSQATTEPLQLSPPGGQSAAAAAAADEAECCSHPLGAAREGVEEGPAEDGNDIQEAAAQLGATASTAAGAAVAMTAGTVAPFPFACASGKPAAAPSAAKLRAALALLGDCISRPETPGPGDEEAIAGAAEEEEGQQAQQQQQERSRGPGTAAPVVEEVAAAPPEQPPAPAAAAFPFTTAGGRAVAAPSAASLRGALALFGEGDAAFVQGSPSPDSSPMAAGMLAPPTQPAPAAAPGADATFSLFTTGSGKPVAGPSKAMLRGALALFGDISSSPEGPPAAGDEQSPEALPATDVTPAPAGAGGLPAGLGGRRAVAITARRALGEQADTPATGASPLPAPPPGMAAMPFSTGNGRGMFVSEEHMRSVQALFGDMDPDPVAVEEGNGQPAGGKAALGSGPAGGWAAADPGSTPALRKQLLRSRLGSESPAVAGGAGIERGPGRSRLGPGVGATSIGQGLRKGRQPFNPPTNSKRFKPPTRLDTTPGQGASASASRLSKTDSDKPAVQLHDLQHSAVKEAIARAKGGSLSSPGPQPLAAQQQQPPPLVEAQQQQQDQQKQEEGVNVQPPAPANLMRLFGAEAPASEAPQAEQLAEEGPSAGNACLDAAASERAAVGAGREAAPAVEGLHPDHSVTAAAAATTAARSHGVAAETASGQVGQEAASGPPNLATEQPMPMQVEGAQCESQPGNAELAPHEAPPTVPAALEEVPPAAREGPALAPVLQPLPLTSKAAAEYTLRMPKAPGAATAAAFAAMPSQHVGHDGARAQLLAAGANPSYASKAWVANHFRWVVWKLARLELAQGEALRGRLLTAAVVLDELKARYEREFNRGQAPLLKRILQHDEPPSGLMVLLVASVQLPPPSFACAPGQRLVARLELTDGWYWVTAQCDDLLTQLVRVGKIAAGDKLRISGAELNSQGPGDPLQAADSSFLKLAANGVRKVPSSTKLGRQGHCSSILPLSSVRMAGGLIPRTVVVVLRKYPRLMWAKFPSGIDMYQTERRYNSMQLAAEADIGKVESDIVAEVQQREVEECKHLLAHGKRGGLSKIERLYAEMVCEKGGGLERLSPGECESLRRLQEERSRRMQQQLQELMQERRQQLSRVPESATHTLLLLVGEVCHLARANPRRPLTRALITIRKPPEEMEQVKEGQVFSVSGLEPDWYAAKDLCDSGPALKLRPSKRTQWQLLDPTTLRSSLVWSEATRQQLSLEGLRGAARNSEFDFTGVVLKAGPLYREPGSPVSFQWVFLADSSIEALTAASEAGQGQQQQELGQLSRQPTAAAEPAPVVGPRSVPTERGRKRKLQALGRRDGQQEEGQEEGREEWPGTAAAAAAEDGQGGGEAASDAAAMPDEATAVGGETAAARDKREGVQSAAEQAQQPEELGGAPMDLEPGGTLGASIAAAAAAAEGELEQDQATGAPGGADLAEGQAPAAAEPASEVPGAAKPAAHLGQAVQPAEAGPSLAATEQAAAAEASAPADATMAEGPEGPAEAPDAVRKEGTPQLQPAQVEAASAAAAAAPPAAAAAAPPAAAAGAEQAEAPFDPSQPWLLAVKLVGQEDSINWLGEGDEGAIATLRDLTLRGYDRAQRLCQAEGSHRSAIAVRARGSGGGGQFRTGWRGTVEDQDAAVSMASWAAAHDSVVQQLRQRIVALLGPH